MRAGELCIRVVATATADENVVAAAQRMQELRVGDLIVVHDGADRLPHPIGIVTDRDLVVRVLAEPTRVPMETKIGDVMRKDLVTAYDHEDVERVIEKMRRHGIRRIPIIDSRGGLQGVLALDDVIGWMRDQIQAATKVLERQAGGPQ